MPSSPTTRNRVEKQATGENINVWGDRLNQYGLDLIDEALDGVETVAIASTAVVLTSSNYASDQARNRALVLTGTLTANTTITVPSVEKVYLVDDQTTRAGFTLTMKASGGAGYALRPGPQWVFCDATDVRRGQPRMDQLPLPAGPVDMNGQNLTNGGGASFSQPVTVGAPTDPAHAATKKFVEDTAFSAASGSLPAQAGNAGLYLKTNGDTAGWGPVTDFAAGTASAPGLAVTGDSNTGLAQIGGPDTLSAVGGGKELTRFNQDGLVVNPGRLVAQPKLSIQGPNATEDYEFQRDGATGLLVINGLQSGYSGYSFRVNNGTVRLKIPNSGPVTVDDVPIGAGFLLSGTPTKAANYSIAAGDGGGVIKCTAALTLTLLAASSLSAGWWVTISNRSAGTVTITPSGSDTVGSASSWTIRAWQDLTIYRTGPSTFEVLGLGSSVVDGIATWSPTYKGSGVTLSNGNLTAAVSVNNAVRATVGQSSGKRYFEVVFAAVGSAGFGVQTASGRLDAVVGSDAVGWGYLSDGRKYTGGAGTAYGSTYASGAVGRIAHDIDAGKLWVAIGSVWQGGGDPVAGTSPMFTGVTGSTYYPAIGDFGGSTTGTGNFLTASFAYAPPTGFLPYY